MSLEKDGTIVDEVANDIIPISNLSLGKYTLTIQYMMSIPESYKTYMQTLASQY
jgi:hypothetical protein